MRIMVPSEKIQNLKITVELWKKGDSNTYTATRYPSKEAGSTGYTVNLETWKAMSEFKWADKSDVYIKSIEYTVDSFTTGYNSGGPNRTVGATGVYTVQYFAEREGNGVATNSKAILTITDVNDTNNVIEAEVEPVFEDTGTATVALSSDTEFRDLSDNPLNGGIETGTPFYLYSSTTLSSYLYYNANFLEDPVIRVKVPNGIEIDFDQTVFSFDKDFSTQIPFTVNKTNPGTAKDGSRVYTFEFPDVTLGGIKSDFTINDNPIYIKVYMTSRRNVKTLALDTQDTIFIDSKSMTLNTGGSWHPHRLRDTNDANLNNNVWDFVFTTDKSKILSFTASIWIDSDLKVLVNNNPLASTSADLKDYDDTFTLRLELENNASAVIDKDNSSYYFPVPKNKAILNKNFGSGNQEFDLSLVSVTVPTSALKVLYSTDTSAYMDPEGANYVETPPSNLEDVTMVKIVAIKDLVHGTKGIIDVVYKYGKDSENFIYDASYQNFFAPYGKISMTPNGSSGAISGYDTFSQVTITLKPIISKNPQDIVVNWNEDGSTSFDSYEAYRIQSAVWQKYENGNWVDIAGSENTGELILKNNQFNQNGELYRVSVTATDGTVYNSKPAKLIVQGYIVTIPKEITLDSTTGSSEYDLSLQAQVPTDKVLVVEPDSSFQMTQVGKSDITGTVTQSKVEWKTDELDPHQITTQKGTIQVNGLSAGEWSGNFNFTIGFENK